MKRRKPGDLLFS